jgi:DNA-binding IclR family transcriptional regulator
VDKLRGDRALEILLSACGRRLPAYCSGVGKVLLASRPSDEIRELFRQQSLVPFTPNTITNLDRLQEELEQVRRQGYAYDREEATIGLCCAAAPIRDADGTTIAAMSLSVPAYRFYPQQQRLTTGIVQAARRVSSRLGYYEREELPWKSAARSGLLSSAPATSERT